MRVAAVYIHPVKGMRALPVAEAVVEPWGLAGDRRWAVVDHRGKVVTQRECPNLAGIVAQASRAGLRLAKDGAGHIDVSTPSASMERVRVFDEIALASRAGDRASEWLSDALGAQVRLVHMGEPQTARALTGKGGRAGEAVSFADEYPVLLTSVSSLASLNAALGDNPVGMDRFRPNIVIEGAAPWSEEGWEHLRIGEAPFRAPSACRRCVVITVDQRTGRVRTPGEPLKSLTRLNRGGTGMPLFGRNLIPDRQAVIRVGDVISVVAAEEHAGASADAEDRP